MATRSVALGGIILPRAPLGRGGLKDIYEFRKT
jgi:hypothetical protein